MENKTMIEHLAIRFVCYHEMARIGFTGMLKDARVTEQELKILLSDVTLTKDAPYQVVLSDKVFCDIYFDEEGELLASKIYSDATSDDEHEQLLKELRM